MPVLCDKMVRFATYLLNSFKIYFTHSSATISLMLYYILQYYTQLSVLLHAMIWPSITKIGLKITCIEFHWNHPGANILTHLGKEARMSLGKFVQNRFTWWLITYSALSHYLIIKCWRIINRNWQNAISHMCFKVRMCWPIITTN